MEKTTVDFKGTVDKAIDRYVKDRENRDFNPSEVVGLTTLKRLSAVDRLLPQHLTNVPISSNKAIEFVREAKLRVNLTGSQSQILANEIASASSDFWSSLDDVQNELKALDSDIQEEEIKAEDKFQQVHFNAFNRPIDTFYRQTRTQQVDPKTGLPFLSDQLLHILPGVGLTLPRVQEERIFIKDIIILDEETDVGDTPVPLIRTDPKNLIDPDLSFRYVIARKAFDDTGRLYNYTESTCKLLVQLGHIQLINHINLRPASHSPLFVKAVEYMNEAGERVQVELDSLSLDGNLDLLLEPIRTNNLLITLVQYAPVEQTEIFTGDLRKEQINAALEGASWSVTLDSPGEFLKARIYDFSLESLNVKLLSYKQSGYFLSQKISVEKPLSFSIAVDTETIKISSEQRAYGSEYFLPEDTVLYETYIKVILDNQIKQKQILATIPIPSTKKVQSELLPIIGGIAPTCFVPDLFYSSMKYRVKNTLYLGEYAFIELEKEHGIPLGVIYTDKLEIFTGIENTTLNFVSELWEALTSTLLVLKRSDGVSLVLAGTTENSTPKAFVLRHLGAEPLVVYREETKLSLGADYIYSLDNGVTWFTELLTLAQFAQLKEIMFAGSFRIKLLDPDYDKYYWCTYKRENTQYLHPSKLFLLKKNSVIVSPRARELKGTLQTMIILRADSRIPYLSSVIHNYKLKVRQL